MLSALLRSGTLTAVVVALAGCGGGGGDEQAASSGERARGDGVTEAQWRAEVNKLCASNHLAAERLVRQLQAKDLSEKELTIQVLRRSAKMEGDMLDDLGAIPAPASIQPQFDRFVDRLGDALPLFQKLADAIEQGQNDPELTTAAARLAADTRPFATQHGLTRCLPDQN